MDAPCHEYLTFALLYLAIADSALSQLISQVDTEQPTAVSAFVYAKWPIDVLSPSWKSKKCFPGLRKNVSFESQETAKLPTHFLFHLPALLIFQLRQPGHAAVPIQSGTHEVSVTDCQLLWESWPVIQWFVHWNKKSSCSPISSPADRLCCERKG